MRFTSECRLPPRHSATDCRKRIQSTSLQPMPDIQDASRAELTVKQGTERGDGRLKESLDLCSNGEKPKYLPIIPSRLPLEFVPWCPKCAHEFRVLDTRVEHGIKQLLPVVHGGRVT
jgi:hypothetical protein